MWRSTIYIRNIVGSSFPKKYLLSSIKHVESRSAVGLQLSHLNNSQQRQLNIFTRHNHGRQDSSTHWNSGWCSFGLGAVFTVVFIATDTLKNYNLTRFMPKVSAAGPSGDGVKLGLRTKYNFIADVVEKVSPAVVYIENSTFFRQGAGSGFIISNDGMIITNAHVVQSARNGEVKVKLVNGTMYTGKVTVVDTASDLALIKINARNLPTITLGQSESLRPGEYVVAVGSPLSLSNTVTSGIVSSTGRNSKELGLQTGINYIQTDAPITYGNSGGPLINLDGEAVGVNSMKVTDGISFAIPSDYVKQFLVKAQDFQQGKLVQKRCRPPYIGVMTLTLTPHVAAQLRNRADIVDFDIDKGLFVVQVNIGSPAHNAGIRKYDTIMKVDNMVIEDHNDLMNAIRDKTVVKCVIYREGKILEIHIRPQCPAE